MRKKLHLLSIGFYLLLSLVSCNSSNVKEVSTEELHRIDLSKVQILDVRTPSEFKENHIRNAVNIDWLGTEFLSGIKNLDKKRKTYLYCRSGRRSHAATKALLKAGFEAPINVKGGIIAWKKNGFPTIH